VNNLISGLIFLFILTPSNSYNNNCGDAVDFHPVKSDIMMQIVLKSYGYYEGKIDGLFGANIIKFVSFFSEK
jgi:hypothetical protein